MILFRPGICAAAVLLSLMVAWGQSGAQIVGGRPARAPGDSMAALAAALSAQLEFERVRLQFMPYGSSGSGSECSEIIGRFCYTFGDRSGKSESVPKEMDAVVTARTRLVRKLDSLVGSAGADPGDWLTGTLIRYRIEAGQHEAAHRTLDFCGATPWWCAALRGLVYHSAARHLEAKRAFDESRSMMQPYILCEWENIADLLSTEDARIYKTKLCDERMRLARNVWWLADPLFSQPGNDRRSDHDSRRVMERLSERGVNPTWLRWGDDMAEIVVRFGWPDYWRRYWSSMGDPNATSPRISQFTLEPSYHFLPTLKAMVSPASALQEDWELLPRDSREEYSPDSVIFGQISSQHARFLRGDSLLIVARASVVRDSLLSAEETLDITMIALRSESDTPATAQQRVGSDEFTIMSRMTNEDRVGSIELLTDSHRAARSRFGIPAITRNAAGHAISDLLLFAGDTAGGEPTVERLAAVMHASPELRGNSPLGVFWEFYGLREGDEVSVALAAIPDERGFMSRLGQALRLVKRPAQVSLSWRETRNRNADMATRSVQLDLATLAPGRYTLRLSASINGGAEMVREKRVEVTR